MSAARRRAKAIQRRQHVEHLFGDHDPMPPMVRSLMEYAALHGYDDALRRLRPIGHPTRALEFSAPALPLDSHWFERVGVDPVREDTPLAHFRIDARGQVTRLAGPSAVGPNNADWPGICPPCHYPEDFQ